MKHSLKTITTQALLAELEKRKQTLEAEESEDVLYIGIIDNEGIDSLVPIFNKEIFAKIHGKLDLRARFNTQRNPEMFAVKIPQILANTIKNKPSLEGAKMLKGLSVYKSIAY